MTAAHFKRLVLILIWQAAMVAGVLYFDSSPRRWIPGAFGVAALLLPFVGYIAAFDDAPLLTKWSRIVKASVLTLASVAVTIVGYGVLFLTGLLIRGDL